MSLHLHSHHSYSWTLHEPLTQIPTLRLLHLLEAVATCRFASPQLHFMPGPISSRAASFEGWPSGPPWGPGVLPQGRSSSGPGWGAAYCHPKGAGTAGTPALWGLFSIKLQQCHQVPRPNPFFQLFFFFLLSSPHCGSFLVKLFQGTLYFSKNSDIIPIRW